MIDGRMNLVVWSMALLPIFHTQANTQAVWSGQHPMTAEQIHQLAMLFQVPHELFFESVFMGG
jgi:hypothetical protein